MSKPTFLFCNFGGDFESVAMRVKEEGYPILYWIARKPERGTDETGFGIFEKDEQVGDLWDVLNTHPREELILLFDDNGQGSLADHLRSDGYTVLGGGKYCDDIEYKRSLGMQVMADIGLAMPKQTDFTNLNQGIAFLEALEAKKPEQRFVFKPEGEAFAGSSKTYTGKNVEDLLEYLKWLKQDCLEKHYSIQKFIFQEFIEGYEADFSAYFDGEKFMEGSLCLDIEEKKAGDGNKGQATGCLGNVCYFLPFNVYYEKYMRKLAPKLAEAGYVGQISINNIFDKRDGKPYGLELTPRFGWDAHTTEMAIHKEAGHRVADFYLALANGERYPFSHTLAGCGVRVHCNTPGTEKGESQGRRFTYDEAIAEQLYFYAVSYKHDAHTIEDNVVLVANTAAPTITAAVKACYEDVLPKINISDIYYRMEIGKRAPEVIGFLKKWGWL